MSDFAADGKSTDGSDSGQKPAAARPEFRYVEELVRYELSASLGGLRGLVEGALPMVGFTVAWVVGQQLGLDRSLYLALGVALACAVVLGLIRVLQKQSVKYVAQAVFPTAIAAIIAVRTGRAEDAFLPGILYNGGLAALSILTIIIGKPLVGFILGAATGDPTGWSKDRGLVRMTSKLTAVLAVPYVLRFVIQLPLYLAHQVVWLGVAKVVLGWPLLVGALFVIGLLLSKGRTPIEGTAFGRGANQNPPTRQ